MTRDSGSKAALDSFVPALEWLRDPAAAKALIAIIEDEGDHFIHPSGHSFTLSAEGLGYVHDDSCPQCEAERVSRAAEQDLNRGTGQDTW